jgi:hypothetical protein
MATGKTVTLGTAAPNTGGPVWSGDGTRVAWISWFNNPESGCDEEGIYAAPSDGNATATRMDLHLDMFSDWCSYPPNVQIGSWSPDSRSILLTGSSYHQGRGISLARLDLTTGQSITMVRVGCDLGDNCIDPTMSAATYGPKGVRVLFSMSGGYPDQVIPPFYSTVPRIYAIDAPTLANFHQVSTGSGYDPTSSPTGTSVLFTRNAGTTTNIMKSGVDATSKPRVLIKNASQADWQSTH